MNNDSKFNPNNNSYDNGMENYNNSSYDNEVYDNPYRNDNSKDYYNSNIYDSSNNYGNSDGLDTSLPQPYTSGMINKSMPYEIDLDDEFVDDFGYDNAGTYQQPTYQDDVIYQENMYSQEGYIDDTYIDNTYTQDYEPPYQEDAYTENYIDDTLDDDELDDDDISYKLDKKSPKYRKMKWLFIVESFAIVFLSIAVYITYTLSKFEGLGQDLDESKITVDTSVKKEGYLTIALLGLDASDEGAQRSDSIMIANINQSTGEIQLVSVYRDTFLYIDGWKEYLETMGFNNQPTFTKVNAAYSMGVESTLKTLNYNLSLDIQSYIGVDFASLAGLVDAIGGIEVTIPDKANFTYFINKYGSQAAKAAGDSYTKLDDSAIGQTVLLDGYQALGYCRVRKHTDYDKAHGYTLSGESDFTRAARQQEVIGKIIENVKSQGVSKLNSIMEVFQKKNNLQSNYTSTELIGLATDAIENNYHLSEDEKISFPLTPHEVTMWGKTSTQFSEYTLLDDVKALHAYLYPDKELTDKELTYVNKISEQLEVYEAKYSPSTQKTKPADTTTDTSTTTDTASTTTQ